ncbi:hypothetical protein DFH07DRAFT_774217 [Mycena maculata]|uniref:Uncharacterized protein n=1 Tax=Mycena maculata TaxID=230809 RepID=A0AAD7NBR0_9AGAR|nr:hypothetical protein DFH07DRAFT_774217 [Mycena maculata]
MDPKEVASGVEAPIPEWAHLRKGDCQQERWGSRPEEWRQKLSWVASFWGESGETGGGRDAREKAVVAASDSTPGMGRLAMEGREVAWCMYRRGDIDGVDGGGGSWEDEAVWEWGLWPWAMEWGGSLCFSLNSLLLLQELLCFGLFLAFSFFAPLVMADFDRSRKGKKMGEAMSVNQQMRAESRGTALRSREKPIWAEGREGRAKHTLITRWRGGGTSEGEEPAGLAAGGWKWRKRPNALSAPPHRDIGFGWDSGIGWGQGKQLCDTVPSPGQKPHLASFATRTHPVLKTSSKTGSVQSKGG